VARTLEKECRLRNSDIELHVSDAERARRAGDPRGAYDGFVEAGRCAEQYGLWKTALRCYRNAVELDLINRLAVDHLARIAVRAGAGGEWAEYSSAILSTPSWPHVSCRSVQLLIGGSGAVVDCPRVGTVFEVVMAADDLINVQPETRFADVPVALALLLVRRAMWPSPREASSTSHDIRVTYRGKHRYRLTEHGDWSRL
jgi:hypothetical protein